MRVLAADVGGTKTLLAVAEATADGLRVVEERRYDSAAFTEFADLVEDFVAPLERRPERACIAVAGPIDAGGRTAHVTNVSWRIDAKAMESRFDMGVALINDFQAQARGVAALCPDDLFALQKGKDNAEANRAIIGAGTGLGFAQLVRMGDDHVSLPSEAGHADFAPRGTLQRELHAWLEERHGSNVSVEHVLSGPGLSRIYRFLADREPARVHADLGREMVVDDFAASVSRFALKHGDGLAREALDVFVSVYGAHAGSLALVTLPYGGMFISGGIAAHILSAMTEEERFIAAFNDKGKMSHIVRSIPVAIIVNPRVGLLGALRAAVQ
ncbi:MAG: glucokinase [Gammaproteobacteria bacterium]|jgi:glucokinase|nr:glucokinase [Gammaproteobacteria bacterium]